MRCISKFLSTLPKFYVIIHADSRMTDSSLASTLLFSVELFAGIDGANMITWLMPLTTRCLFEAQGRLSWCNSICHHSMTYRRTMMRATLCHIPCQRSYYTVILTRLCWWSEAHAILCTGRCCICKQTRISNRSPYSAWLCFHCARPMIGCVRAIGQRFVLSDIIAPLSCTVQSYVANSYRCRWVKYPLLIWCSFIFLLQ